MVGKQIEVWFVFKLNNIFLPKNWKYVISIDHNTKDKRKPLFLVEKPESSSCL